jgi:hypothetical protein
MNPAMGTTFVTISRGNRERDPGFWMRDGMLELYLRLLALHLPEPTDAFEPDQSKAVLSIRNEWLLASIGVFNGCVPHGLEKACETEHGRSAVKKAIELLNSELDQATTPLDGATLNLLGIHGSRFENIERKSVRDVGRAFQDLIEGRITDTASETRIMPGSKPYP